MYEIQQQHHTLQELQLQIHLIFVAWGEAASGDLVIDPGMWSIDNFGDKAICLIVDGEVFEWNSAATDATNSRATIITNVHQQHQDTCLYLHQIDT